MYSKSDKVNLSVLSQFFQEVCEGQKFASTYLKSPFVDEFIIQHKVEKFCKNYFK